MRIAVVYDFLPAIEGGAERVLIDIIHSLKPTDLFIGGVVESNFSNQWIETILTKNPELKLHIHSKFKGPLKFFRFRLFNYLLPSVLQSFRTSEFDVLFCYTSFLAHTALTPSNGKKIVYLNTPSRMIWHLTHSNSFWKKLLPSALVSLLQSKLRVLDVAHLYGAEIYGISNDVLKRVKTFYNRDASLLSPPVHIPILDHVKPSKDMPKLHTYFVHVSRIESYKNIRLLIDYIAEFKPNEQFFIVGTGPDLANLKNYSEKKLQMAAHIINSEISQNATQIGNVIFTGFLAEDIKNQLIANAIATFSLNDEDFGLSKVESMALGTPVIALDAGASREIIDTPGGILFPDNTIESLATAIEQCKLTTFDKAELKKRAQKYSLQNFTQKLQSIIKQ